MQQKNLPFSLKEGEKKIINGRELTLFRIINQGVLLENDGTPCNGNENPFIETICRDTNGLFYICDCGMQPVDKGYNTLEDLVKVHGKGGITEFNDLQTLAVELYNKFVTAPQYQQSFLESVKSGVSVFDMRKNGFYCSYCGEFAEKETSFATLDKVIFIYNGMFSPFPKQIWIVNTHYDGCRGWE
jgi:hypothetical protein